MSKEQRKKISERLLRERLSLDEDWLNRDEDGVAHVPSALPDFLAKRLQPKQLAKLEEAVRALVRAGCRREALYFCIAQLGPEAKLFRAGSEPVHVRGSDADYGELLRRKVPLATKEDMAALANKARAARKLIHKYRAELLLVAETDPSELPGGVLTTQTDADEALSVLTNSLTWVSKVASRYSAPFAATLLKSKEILYLTLYISMFASPHRPEPPGVGKFASKPKSRSKRAVLSVDVALATIARSCTGKQWSPSDLHGKLKRFHQGYPALYARMRSKLAELHGAAAVD